MTPTRGASLSVFNRHDVFLLFDCPFRHVHGGACMASCSTASMSIYREATSAMAATESKPQSCSGVGIRPMCRSGKFWSSNLGTAPKTGTPVWCSMFCRVFFWCLAPATRLSTTPFKDTSGSKWRHPKTMAAMVRVDLVQSRHKMTGTCNSLASFRSAGSAVKVDAVVETSVTFDDRNVGVEGVALEGFNYGRVGCEVGVEIVAGPTCRQGKPARVYVVRPLFGKVLRFFLFLQERR